GVGRAYVRHTSRASEDPPCVGVAAVLGDTPGGRLEHVRVAVGAVAATPRTLPAELADAAGRTAPPGRFGAVANAYAQQLDPLDDERGSAWYRTRMIEVHVRRALAEAHRRAAR